MLNYIWAFMILIGVVYGAIAGKMAEVTNAALDSAGDAVSLCITMIGVMALWVGLMEIAQKSGAVFHKDKSYFELQSLAQRIQIAFPECKFQPWIDEWQQLVILHYLDLADGTEVSQEMVFLWSIKGWAYPGNEI